MRISGELLVSRRVIAMQHQTTLTYSQPLIRQAVWGFWRRVVGVRFAFALALMTVALVFLLLAGDRSWQVGVIATTLAFGILFLFVLFFVHYRNSVQKFRALGDNARAELTATASALSFSSAAGTASIPWSSVCEVWRFPTFWLLLFSKAQFSTLPLTDVSPELQEFILERVRAAGGKIG